MRDQIQEVVELGFKPYVFIDSDLLSVSSIAVELKEVIKHARLLSVPVVYTKEIEFLNRARKAYVFRYGYLSDMTEAYIKRKGGKVVSGNLKVSLTV